MSSVHALRIYPMKCVEKKGKRLSKKREKRKENPYKLNFLVVLYTAGAETFFPGCQTNRMFLGLCRRPPILCYFRFSERYGRFLLVPYSYSFFNCKFLFAIYDYTRNRRNSHPEPSTR